jgi:apolipoprotein N-acyltransferase
VVIWGDKLYYIKENPSVLILGLGWGRMGETGANAHMLPLQILMETGVIGLAFFFFLMRSLLRALWNSGEIGQSLALATLGLLVTSAAQEVFYPIPSMGSFLGVFLALCGLAAAARLDPSTHRGGVQ